MSKKVKIKKAPSGKQLRKIRKSLGIAGEEYVALELLLEDFLGQSAESLYCVYGLSMAPIDTDMFDSTACDWWELVESRGRRPSPYNTGEGALMVQLGDKVTCAGFGVLVLSKEKDLCNYHGGARVRDTGVHFS